MGKYLTDYKTTGIHNFSKYCEKMTSELSSMQAGSKGWQLCLVGKKKKLDTGEETIPYKLVLSYHELGQLDDWGNKSNMQTSLGIYVHCNKYGDSRAKMEHNCIIQLLPKTPTSKAALKLDTTTPDFFSKDKFDEEDRKIYQELFLELYKNYLDYLGQDTKIKAPDMPLSDEEKLNKEKDKRIENAWKAGKKARVDFNPQDIISLFPSEEAAYRSLGWLAKHTKSIVARILDIDQEWFKANFGEDTPIEKILSTERTPENTTSGGFPKNIGDEFMLTCDDEIDPTIFYAAEQVKTPTGFMKDNITKTEGKTLSNVQFIGSLVCDYGFKFGTGTQDIEAIRSTLSRDSKLLSIFDSAAETDYSTMKTPGEASDSLVADYFGSEDDLEAEAAATVDDPV